MAMRIFRKRPGYLFRRSNSGIGQKVAMNGMRLVKIQYFTRQVCAVREEEAEISYIFARIEIGDESIILRLSGFDAKAINFSDVGCAYQLSPFPFRRAAIRRIGDEL